MFFRSLVIMNILYYYNIAVKVKPFFYKIPPNYVLDFPCFGDLNLFRI